MVVVPTSKHVKLVYGTTTAEWVGRAGTVVGFVGLGLLVWWGWRSRTAKGDGAPKPTRSSATTRIAEAGAEAGTGDDELPDNRRRRRSTVRLRSP